MLKKAVLETGRGRASETAGSVAYALCPSIYAQVRIRDEDLVAQRPGDLPIEQPTKFELVIK